MIQMEFFFLSASFLCLGPIPELQLAVLDFSNPYIMTWTLVLPRIHPSIYHQLDNIVTAFIISSIFDANPAIVDYSWCCSLSSCWCSTSPCLSLSQHIMLANLFLFYQSNLKLQCHWCFFIFYFLWRKFLIQQLHLIIVVEHWGRRQPCRCRWS